jgi:hypothetical protein
MAEDDEQMQAADGDILEESNAEAMQEADKEPEPEAPTVDLESLPAGELSATEVAESRRQSMAGLKAISDSRQPSIAGSRAANDSQKPPTPPMGTPSHPPFHAGSAQSSQKITPAVAADPPTQVDS